MQHDSMDAAYLQDYRLSARTSLEIGLMRLVRLALRAWRILVRARVRFSAADLPMSNCTPHCAGFETTRPFLGPAVHLQAILSRPERLLRQTF